MIKVLEEAEAIIITAGAGMGVDSGLPDFRGNEGFWKAYPAIEKLGIDFKLIASPMWFKNKPELAWAFYGHRLNLYRNTVPHKGFKILKEIVKGKDYFIYTSNVDGQFQKAGFPDNKIAESHGSIHYLQCSCGRGIFSANRLEVDVDMHKFEAITVPICSTCNNTLRPNILMFGDFEWNSSRSDEQDKRRFEFFSKNREKNIVIIEIGAGTAISTIRDFSNSLSILPNVTLIRINPREYDVRDGNISIAMGGLYGLESLMK